MASDNQDLFDLLADALRQPLENTADTELEALRAAVELRQHLNRLIDDTGWNAVALGATFAKVAAAAQMTRQAAHQRWGDARA